MDLEKLKNIIKYGCFLDVYEINKKAFYKILHQGTIYLISEYKNKIKLEGTM